MTISTNLPKSARERILATAHNLFYQEGIRATGVDRLIAESSVTKTTFYRHFPSKNDLIMAFLRYRNELLQASFKENLHKAIANQPSIAEAICAVMGGWFHSESFRGCAFINSVGELGEVLPEVLEVTRQHKQQTVDAIEQVLPPSPQRAQLAIAIGMAMDGATIQAQYQQSPDTAIAALKYTLSVLLPES